MYGKPPVSSAAPQVTSLVQKKKLSLYIAHGSVTYGKFADRPDSRISYTAYDPNELAILFLYDKPSDLYQVKVYRDGLNIEQEIPEKAATATREAEPASYITSIPTVLSASALLDLVRDILNVHEIDAAEIMLALDGNLEVAGDDFLSERFYQFVDIVL